MWTLDLLLAPRLRRLSDWLLFVCLWVYSKQTAFQARIPCWVTDAPLLPSSPKCQAAAASANVVETKKDWCIPLMTIPLGIYDVCVSVWCLGKTYWAQIESTSWGEAVRFESCCRICSQSQISLNLWTLTDRKCKICTNVFIFYTEKSFVSIY